MSEAITFIVGVIAGAILLWQIQKKFNIKFEKKGSERYENSI